MCELFVSYLTLRVHVSAAGKCLRRYSLERQSACGEEMRKSGREEEDDRKKEKRKLQRCFTFSILMSPE